MNDIIQFVLEIFAQVTAASGIALLLLWLFQGRPAKQHVFGLVGSSFIAISPILVALLPSQNWQSIFVSSRRTDAIENSQSYNSITGAAQEHAFQRETEGLAASKESLTEITALDSKPVFPESGDLSESQPESSISISPTMYQIVCIFLLAIWIVGAILLSLNWFCRYRYMLQMVRQCRECTGFYSLESAAEERVRELTGIRRIPEVIATDLVPSAMVCGIFKPSILLPKGLVDAGDSQQLRAVLIHECTHVARGDLLIQFIQHFESIIWWWHPFVRWMNPFIARAREEICDNAVLREIDSRDYAELLLDLAVQRSSLTQATPAIEILGSVWTLEDRIRGLMCPTRDLMTRASKISWSLVIATFVMVSALIGGTNGSPHNYALVGSILAGFTEQPASAELETMSTPDIESLPDSGVQDRTVTGVLLDDNDQPLPGGKLYWIVGEKKETIESLTDEKGAFELKTKIAETANDQLWVYAKGYEVSAISAKSFSNGRPQELKMKIAHYHRFQVVSPERQPVPNAIVKFEAFEFSGKATKLPPEIQQLVSSTSDSQGQVELLGLVENGARWISVTSHSESRQYFYFCRPSYAPDMMLQLKKEGRIEGNVSSDDPHASKQLSIRVETTGIMAEEDRNNTPAGSIRVVTDSNGKFVVPAIAEGPLRIKLELPVDSTFVTQVPEEFAPVKADATTSVQIQIQKGTRVRCVVREQETNRPIPGVQVDFAMSTQRSFRLTSDAAGLISTNLLAGKYNLIVRERPESAKELMFPLPKERPFEVSKDEDLIDLPPLEMLPSKIVRGKVINSNGLPRVGAYVVALNGANRKDEQFVAGVAMDVSRSRWIGGAEAFDPYLDGGCKTDDEGNFALRLPKDWPIDGYEILPFYVPGLFAGGAAPAVIEKESPLVLKVTEQSPIALKGNGSKSSESRDSKDNIIVNRFDGSRGAKPNGFTDQELAEVQSKPGLWDLFLNDAGFTDKNLEKLVGWEGLVSLGLQKNPISDRGLETIGQLKKLESLNISQTEITDDGLKYLASLSNLKELYLDYTAITNRGIAQISELPRLEKLWISNTRIDNEAALSLLKLSKLAELNIESTLIDGKGLRLIGRMTNLRWLKLSGLCIDDQAMESLRGMPELIEIYLSDSVTTKSLPVLESMPQLRILHCNKIEAEKLRQWQSAAKGRFVNTLPGQARWQDFVKPVSKATD